MSNETKDLVQRIDKIEEAVEHLEKQMSKLNLLLLIEFFSPWVILWKCKCQSLCQKLFLCQLKVTSACSYMVMFLHDQI